MDKTKTLIWNEELYGKRWKILQEVDCLLTEYFGTVENKGRIINLKITVEAEGLAEK